MPAPQQQGRSRDAIAADILAVIDPPADGREACRAKVVDYINFLRRFQQLQLPPPGEFKGRLAAYLKNLGAAKRTFVDWPFWELSWPEHKQFLALLDAEIERIKFEHDGIAAVPHGSRQRDLIAQIVVQLAASFLDPERQTQTEGGPWDQLSMLLYEAVTGQPNCTHLFGYLREHATSPRGGPTKGWLNRLTPTSDS